MNQPLRPPLPSPSELVRGDRNALMRGSQVDSLFDRGPQADALRKADPESVYEAALSDRIPLPAQEDSEGYTADGPLPYWLFGLGDALWLRSLAEQHGTALGEGSRILDFGCSSGRVLRHFPALAPAAELHGVDIAARYVAWSRAHLPAGISVVQGTTIPSLPFPDAYFDVIYACSVFTHIDEFEEAWLEELSRVLKPSGLVALTFHPDRVWEEMARDPEYFLRTLLLSDRTRMDPPGVKSISPKVFSEPLPGPRVVFTSYKHRNLIHSREWVEGRWGRVFHVEDIVEHAHGDHQDAMIGVARH